MPPVHPMPSGRRNNAPTSSLYVGDLARGVTEATLFKLFNTVGPVASIRVCRDAVTKRSLRYGYVNFHDAVDAERALDTLNFTSVEGVPIRIMWSQRDPSLRKSGKGNVIVKKLDGTIDHKTLFDTFSIFGDILSCKVALDDEGQSLSYGFVHFAEESAADKCIDKVNDMLIKGKTVQVQKWAALEERIKNFTNVYVKNVPGNFSEKDFQTLFEQYGPLEKILPAFAAPFIMRKPQNLPGVDTYWGFCNYLKHADAQAAVDGLAEKKVQDKEIYCHRALTRGEKIRRKKQRYSKLRQEQRLKSKHVNVFVKNLSEKIDDERLGELFKDFGVITSCKVARDASQQSKGFGFVCFTKPDEATRAITDMNTKIVDGKPLYVARHQPRDERSAELHRRFQSENRGYHSPQRRYSRNRVTSGGYGNGYGASSGPPYQQGPTAGYAQPYGVQAGFRPQYPPPLPYPPNVMRPYNSPQRPGGPAPPPPAHHQRRSPYHQSDMGYNVPPMRQVPVPGGHHHGSRTPPSRRSSSGSSLNMQQMKIKLANADPQQQKQMIGEQLFPQIQSREPKLAGKITGMLLEMDNTELLHLLDTPSTLYMKINEALHVLRQHQQGTMKKIQKPMSILNTPSKAVGVSTTGNFGIQTPLAMVSRVARTDPATNFMSASPE